MTKFLPMMTLSPSLCSISFDRGLNLKGEECWVGFAA